MEMSEERRQNVLMMLAIMSLLCFFSSFLLFVMAIHIKLSLDARINLLETYNSSVIPGVFLAVGLLNLAQNSTCTYTNFKLRDPENRQNLLLLVMILLVTGILLVIIEFSTAIAVLVHVGVLNHEFGQGVQKALAAYSIGEELKKEIDYVQIFFRCCGDKGYTDWFKHLWSDAAMVNSEDEMADISQKQQLGKGMESLTDDVPFSCCDWHSPRPCIHHNVHDNRRHYNYDYQKETTLYSRGCREVLIGNYSSVLKNIALAGSLVACVQIIVLLLLRLLHTSLLLASEVGNWTATTDAYLYFKRVDVEAEEKALIESEAETDNDTTGDETTTDEEKGDTTTDDDEKDDENEKEGGGETDEGRDQNEVDAEKEEGEKSDEVQTETDEETGDDDDNNQNSFFRRNRTGNSVKRTNTDRNTNTIEGGQFESEYSIYWPSDGEVDDEDDENEVFNQLDIPYSNRTRYDNFFFKMKDFFHDSIAQRRSSKERTFPKYKYLQLKQNPGSSFSDEFYTI